MHRVIAWSFVLLSAVTVVATAQGVAGSRTGGPAFPPPVAVRIHPVPRSEWSTDQQALVARYASDGRTPNDLATFLVHPALVSGVMPFTEYVSSASLLPPRDREILILRIAWLSRSAYIWTAHVGAAAEAGLSNEEIASVGGSVDSSGWSSFDSTLLRAADELHAMSFVSNATWRGLAGRYDTRQLIDAVFTVAHYSMLSMVANSLGTPVDVPPAVLPAAAAAPPPTFRAHTPLDQPRIAALDPSEWTPEVRTMLDPSGSGRPVAAVYRTYAQHPALYAPRQVLSEYIRLGSTLSPRTRELLILRIGYLCGSDYEWAAHARAGRRVGLTDAEILRLAIPGVESWEAADASLVRAVDELWSSDVISDATWSQLAATLDTQQLLDLLITAGGYRMVSMSLNTLGVPLEPDSERFPR